MRPIKCRQCGEKFERRNSLQIVCSPSCAIQYARAKTAKAEAKKNRERKAAIKTRAQWLREAQAALNAWVRYRDRLLPCISCGRRHDGQIHAGHYLSRGAHPELALDERNLHAQCAPCNVHLSGNQANYRKGLISRYGDFYVAWLDGPHEPVKHTIEDAKRIRDEYRARLKSEIRGDL